MSRPSDTEIEEFIKSLDRPGKEVEKKIVQHLLSTIDAQAWTIHILDGIIQEEQGYEDIIDGIIEDVDLESLAKILHGATDVNFNYAEAVQHIETMRQDVQTAKNANNTANALIAVAKFAVKFAPLVL